MFGFEQPVWRTTSPPEELVHHAWPDAPISAGDGSLVSLELPEGRAQDGGGPEGGAAEVDGTAADEEDPALSGRAAADGSTPLDDGAATDDDDPAAGRRPTQDVDRANP